jgi:serine/threonine-protein kinase HipA
MQEFVCGASGRASSLHNAMSECHLFGLTPERAADQILEVIRVVDRWREHFTVCGVTVNDMESLAQSIEDSDIGAQRRKFDPDAAAAAYRASRTSRSGAFRR